MNTFRGLIVVLIALVSGSPLGAQTPLLAPELNVSFTTIDVPGFDITNVLGINTAGELVGNYAMASNSFGYGFLYNAGTFTSFSYPGSNSTLAFGINDSGLIVGTAYIRQDTAAVSFLYDGSTFTTIRAPGGKSYTIANGIDNAGDIVGGAGFFGGNEAFERIGTQYKNVTPPGAHTLVYATAVNNLGQIVGWTDGSPPCDAGSFDCGFYYQGGKFRTLVVPGSSGYTEPWGINDSGTVSGWYSACNPGCYNHGFVLMHGTYFTLDYPGALETYATAINASNQVVGSYTFDQQVYHGFVTSPITEADLR